MISREEATDMSQAHAEGWHTPPDGVPREGCPECEGRTIASYPTAAQLRERQAQGNAPEASS